jgi:hypothetical protein
MGAKLSSIDLNRDDKAHNFVVSLNAFQDGNRLAYLALAIAIGIDSLIFMTGLFGANAVRSPLSDVPSMKARNSQELNAMIETALLPDVFRKARLVCQSMHPIENVEGYSNEVRLDELDPETAVQVREVLNAGAIIGAVRRGDRPGRYLVRSELLEFLNTVIKRELETNREKAERGLTLDQLEDQVVVALLPHVAENCEAVLGELVPIDDPKATGFTSVVSLDDVTDEARPSILNVLNTGATFSVVQREKGSDSYFVHKDLYKTLARIRAREVARGGSGYRLGGSSAAGHRRIAVSAGKAGYGGSLTPPNPAITDQTRKDKPLAASPADPAGYLEPLLGSLGVNPEDFMALEGATFEAALQAGDTLSGLRQNNRLLHQYFADRDEEEHARVTRAFEALDKMLAPEDDLQRQHLVTASEEIAQNWQLIMLLPKGPYERELGELVEDLEPQNGAGSLRNEEQALMIVARRILQDLTANPRRTDKDWMQLDLKFQQLLLGAAQQAAVSDAKRALN